MDGLLFLASVVGVGLVMWWVMTTDWLGRGETADIGLFAMRDGASTGKSNTGKSNTGKPDGGKPTTGKPDGGNSGDAKPVGWKLRKVASRRR